MSVIGQFQASCDEKKQYVYISKEQKPPLLKTKNASTPNFLLMKLKHAMNKNAKKRK